MTKGVFHEATISTNAGNGLVGLLPFALAHADDDGQLVYGTGQTQLVGSDVPLGPFFGMVELNIGDADLIVTVDEIIPLPNGALKGNATWVFDFGATGTLTVKERTILAPTEPECSV